MNATAPSQTFPLGRQTNYLLFCILVFALLLRLWKIDYQSLWLDELHTMNEADPDLPWERLFFYLKCCDQHPPLHFFLSKLMFTLFGHTSIVARIPSVVAGTLSVWAMYVLGKEILNRQLGLIAAALTAVNYFHLVYSQEARNYIFAFLFTVLSFLYFIRLLKDLSARNSILYALFTLLLLYSHYYGLFVLASQLVLMAIFFSLEPNANKLKFAKWLLLSGLIIGLGYLPWVPFLMEMSTIKSFWISPISPNFLVDFYSEYFGWVSKLLWISLLLFLFYMFRVFYPAAHTMAAVKQRPVPFLFIIVATGALLIAFKAGLAIPYSLLTLSLLFLLTIYAIVMVQSEKALAGPLTGRPLPFIFVILSTWIMVTYLIPYVRSVMIVPMLFPRYTIVILPAFLLAIAIGMELIPKQWLKFLVWGVFIVFSMISILSGTKYFSDKRKTQFREMTQYVVENNKNNFPVINEITNWHQQYFFKLHHVKPVMLPGKKTTAVDSILRKLSPRHDVNGFWIVGAHGDKPLTEEERKGLDTAYTLIMERHFRDAWAQFYVQKSEDSATRLLTWNDFEGGAILPDEKSVAIWGGSIQSKPVNLTKGKYQLLITARGTGAKGEMAQVAITANGKKIVDYTPAEKQDTNNFTFEINADETVPFTIALTNDYSDASKREDRNVFIHLMLILKIQ